MNKKVASYAPSVQLNGPQGRIVFSFTDGSTLDANALSLDQYIAAMLTLQASADAYVGHDPRSGTLYIGTKPDIPGSN